MDASSHDFQLRLDVVMETPVVVVPRHERSFDVLVAHLGAITLKNQTVDELADQPRIDRLLVQVTDMNVHSANLADKIDFKSKRRKQSGKGPSNTSGAETSSKMQILTELKKLTAQELYSCRSGH